MENSSFKIEGLKEVTDALKALPVELQGKILKAFIRKVGKKFIVDPLKIAIPYKALASRKGFLMSNSKFIKIMSVANNPLAIRAGVSNAGYKLRWLDLGTKQRTTKKGANRGAIQGHNIIQPTIESKLEPMVDYVQKELGNEINKMLERRLKRLKKS